VICLPDPAQRPQASREAPERWAPCMAAEPDAGAWLRCGVGLEQAAKVALGFKAPLAIAIPSSALWGWRAVAAWTRHFAALGVVAICPVALADQAHVFTFTRGDAPRAEWMHRLARECGSAWAPALAGWDTDDDVARVMSAVARRDRFAMMEGKP
jgi:hypothetical protein